VVAVAAGAGLLGLATAAAVRPRDTAGNATAAWILAALAGGAMVLLGACAVCAQVVGLLEPAAGRLQGAARLAARSLARQPARTSSLVAAVTATAALALAVSAVAVAVDSQEARDDPGFMRRDEVQLTARGPDGLAPVADEVLQEALALVPGATVHQTQVARLRPGAPPLGWQVEQFTPDRPARTVFEEGLPDLDTSEVTLVDDAFLRLYDPPSAVLDALRSSGVVGVSALGGRATVALPEGGNPPVGRTLSVPVVSFHTLPKGVLPPLLVTPERAANLDLVPMAGPTVLRSPHDLTAGQRHALNDLAADLQGTGAELGGSVQQVNQDEPPSRLPTGTIDAALAGLALAACLLVVGVGLALAAAEARDERAVLVALGAQPATIRAAGGYRAVLLTGLGATLALPVGLLPAWALTAASARLHFVAPWRAIGLVLVGIPLAAGAVTTLAGGLTLRHRPPRPDDLAFE
jgi:putative ABC transport system permease protein